MAMTLGGRNKAEINVTPMIDVMLVLLIIYMVASRNTVGLETKLPAESKGPAVENPQDIILLVRADHTVTLNREVVSSEELESKLTSVYRTRGNHPIFIAAEEGLEFESVAHVIDIARGAGLNQVALIPHGSY